MRKGYVEVLADRCKGCEMCVAACPNDLLTFPMETLNHAGYFIAKFVDPEEKCPACKLCAVACPDCAIVVYKRKKEPVAGGVE